MSSYKDGEVLSILYDIWISGTKLDMTKKECVNSIEIKETVEGADTATIQITDPEFLYIEDKIFIEENTIKVSLGWSNTTYRESFSGYISAVDINFDTTGCPKITLTCMDNTHLMNKTKKDCTYNKCTSAEVVKKICATYGYTCVIDETYKFTTQETITQSNQTDIDFIQKLAKDEVYPFTARLVGNVFYYVKMGKLETPKMTLTYKNYPHEIISFSPKINKETKKTEIKSASVKSSTKELDSATGKVETSGGSSTANGSSASKSSSGGYTYSPSSRTWSKEREM